MNGMCIERYETFRRRTRAPMDCILRMRKDRREVLESYGFKYLDIIENPPFKVQAISRGKTYREVHAVAHVVYFTYISGWGTFSALVFGSANYVY